MKVYELDADGDRYQNLMLVQQTDVQASLDMFKGKPMVASWSPMRVAVIREASDTDLPPGDFPSLGGTKPVFSERAVSALGNVLLESGELLPLECDEGRYFAYNVTRVVDALDENRSEVTRFPSSGRIMIVNRYELFPDRLEGINIFKLPQQLTRVYVTDEFVRLVEEAGLTGFRFIPLWSSVPTETAAA